MENLQLIESEDDVTDVVKAAFEGTENPRLKQITTAFVEHAHAFLKEVRLTEEEFDYGLRFISAIGQTNTDAHNEAVLAADVLGLSTLVSLMNNPQSQGQTAAALLGPFWRLNAPQCNSGDNIARSDTPGEHILVKGQVRTLDGQALADVAVDVWQASPVGFYENHDPNQEPMNLRGMFHTDSQGRFHFQTVKPAGYPVPTHGPIGKLLKAQHRHPYRPAHIHFMLSAPGYKTLITQVFVDKPEKLLTDVVFGVSRPLVASLREADASSPDGLQVLEYDFVLNPGESSFPEPPIK